MMVSSSWVDGTDPRPPLQFVHALRHTLDDSSRPRHRPRQAGLFLLLLPADDRGRADGTRPVPLPDAGMPATRRVWDEGAEIAVGSRLD
jgi:hypothetical protein